MRYWRVYLVVVVLVVTFGCKKKSPTDENGNGGITDGWIFFTKSKTSEETGKIYKIRPDGSNLTEIHSGILTSASSSGDKIAGFTGYEDNPAIFVVDQNGGSIFELDNAMYPFISPDGNRLVYYTTDGLRTIKVDGTGKSLLTEKIETETTPAFSPDGEHVVFYGNDTTIYKIDIDGTDETSLSRGVCFGLDFMHGLCWAPSEQFIAFIQWETQGSDRKLCVIKKDGSSKKTLTEATVVVWPKFSPDGNSIVFDKVIGSQINLYTIGIDGSNEKNISVNDSLFVFGGATWSSDGREIAYIALDDINNPQYSYLRVVTIENLNIRTLTECHMSQEMIFYPILWTP